MSSASRVPWWTLVLGALAACQPQSGPASSGADTPEARADTVATAAAEGPCRLLTVTEVRAVLPKAGAGKRDLTRRQYGIDACVWEDDNGRVAVQTWKAKPKSVDNEIRGLSAGFIDPLNPAAPKNIRFESVADVGEQAMAVVETQDQQRGILADVAMLVAQKNDGILVLLSDNLAHRDRAEALSKLHALGSRAADRF